MSEAVYQHYFGLEQAPFAITPDPCFVYLSPRHEDALAHLRYGIGRGGGGGFVQLTGEVGTGKTTLSRLLLEQLPDNARAALVLNPRLDPTELLESLCDELGISTRGARGSLKRLNDRLNDYLLKAHAEGLNVVLIIDEAQNLSPESLEQVRLLTNLETPTQKLLQIVLLGQPELRELLGRSDLRQLAQRITARYHLTPLNAEETAAYVNHRLSVAGAPRSPFAAGALKALYRESGGVPRLINIIAERCLVAAYALDRRRIDAALVRRAAAEVLDRAPPRALGRVATALAVVVGALALAYLSGLGPSDPAPEPPVQVAVSEAAALAPQPEPETAEAPISEPVADGAETSPSPADVEPDSPPAEPELLPNEGFQEAWQRLLAARGATAVEPPSDRRCPLTLAPALFCLDGRGSVYQLRLLGRAVIVELPAESAYAVVRADEDGLWWLADSGEIPVAAARLERRWNGRYWDFWAMPGYVPTLLREGDRGPGVLWVKAAAAAAEPPYRVAADDPYFGPSLTRWVQAFQQRAGLEDDGLIGPETLQFLSRHALPMESG